MKDAYLKSFFPRLGRCPGLPVQLRSFRISTLMKMFERRGPMNDLEDFSLGLELAQAHLVVHEDVIQDLAAQVSDLKAQLASLQKAADAPAAAELEKA